MVKFQTKNIMNVKPNRSIHNEVKQRSPVTGPEGPRDFQEIKVPRFRDNSTGWW